ncbi:KAT8 regulatory NSL complex subunit [Trichinella spiralis]|uniref:KAT8 regulatory NSL complex subunit n=1 Tax=Trichinella spiralis TaxID=6334 RepID=A0ABR3K8C6_TRISP
MDDLRIKIFKTLQRYNDKKVILIGWHLSCDVVLQSCNASNVCGVVLFNFINRAKEHLPAIVSPSLLGCEVPVLFVVGSFSKLCSADFLISIMPKSKKQSCCCWPMRRSTNDESCALQALHLNQLVVNYCILEAVMNYCHQLLKSGVEMMGERGDDGDNNRNQQYVNNDDNDDICTRQRAKRTLRSVSVDESSGLLSAQSRKRRTTEHNTYG